MSPPFSARRSSASRARRSASRSARSRGPTPNCAAQWRRSRAKSSRFRRSVGFLEKQEKRRLGTAPKASAAKGVRFSAKWVKADRERLGLSARDYGLLVGVAGLTIYNWEKGKSKPRDKQLAAWAKARGIGKREAWRRLELLEG